jgi:hypothetical protein
MCWTGGIEVAEIGAWVLISLGSGPPELTQLVKPPVGVEKPRLLAT